MLSPEMRRSPLLILAASAVLGCSSSKATVSEPEVLDADIARPSSGELLLESVPGPMLGSFDTYSEALFAACRKIFTKPHASAGRRPPKTALREEQEAFNLRQRASTEYCAWMYYTPDDKYQISLLTDQATPDPTMGIKRCSPPLYVKDSRYPPDSIKYIVVLHNHTFDTPISWFDVRHIVSQGILHGFEPKTKEGVRRLSVVAFFSVEHESPSCDGFYSYAPYTGKIVKWTRDGNQWHCEQTHAIKWLDDGSLEKFEIKEERAPCTTADAL